MKVFQIIKKLNNTELGKGNTNETYILIPKDLDVSDLFETSDREFTCKKSGMRYKLRITIGRETRIVGLGKFYRSNQLSARDEIVLEKRSYENQTEFLIDSHKKDNSVIFQKLQSGFTALTEDRVHLLENGINVISHDGFSPFEMKNKREVKKRKDSHDATIIYDIFVGGKNISEDYADKEMLEIEMTRKNNIASFGKICKWRKYIFEMED